ncbi:triacylglycerol lipase 3 [Coprinopsis sp. MPI-PUGE-AT-0042]|nr:triacylglycerol lipase 3 [Coprinopsis sp. MPI-PUGE-AT-0042]
MLSHLFALLSISISVLGAEVKLRGTTVVGLDIPTSGVEFFSGLPYAEAPVGHLRFRPPVLKTHLPGSSFNATQFGKSCLQPTLYSKVPPEDQSEDCLSITIYRPAGTKPGAKLPIILWTFGGAFVIGGSSEWDGSNLVARSVQRGTPIIYVGHNFRLGPLGFPIGQEAHNERVLNLSQKDTLTALEWVHQNIDAFGGDKDKITILGHSSGSVKVADLYFVKGIEKLIKGAILESGAAGGSPLWNATERKYRWPSFVKNIPSCANIAPSDSSTLSCLRNVTEEEMKAGYQNPADPSFLIDWWQPTIDSRPGSLLPDFPSKLYRQGKFARIPFIAGGNLDEGTLFVSDARASNYTEAQLRNTLRLTPPFIGTSFELNKTIDRIFEMYPDVPALGSPYGTGNELFGSTSLYKRAAAIQGDITFASPLRHWMQAAAAYNVKAYGYLFSHHNPLEESALGVPHGAVLPYTFGNSLDPLPSGQELKMIMMDYWISFTVSSDPNDGKGVKRPRWPQYTKNNPILIQLEGGNTTTIKDDFRANQIAFLTANAAVLRR